MGSHDGGSRLWMLGEEVTFIGQDHPEIDLLSEPLSQRIVGDGIGGKTGMKLI